MPRFRTAFSLLSLSTSIFLHGDVSVVYSLKAGDVDAEQIRVYASGHKMRVVSTVPYHGGPITAESLKDFATNTEFLLDDGEYQQISLTAIEDALAKERNARQAWGNDEAERARMARHGTITSFMDVKDTGERRSILGFVAKHLIINIRSEVSRDACFQVPTQAIIVDGWYTDPPPGSELLSRELLNWLSSKPPEPDKNHPEDIFGCSDKVIYKLTGDLQDGMPLEFHQKPALGSLVVDFKMTAFSSAPLNAELFNLPHDARPQQPDTGTRRLTSQDVQRYRQWVPLNIRVAFGPLENKITDREVNSSEMLNHLAQRFRDLGFVPVELNSSDPALAAAQADQQHCQYRLELSLRLDGVPDDENDHRPAYDDFGDVTYRVFDQSGEVVIGITGGTAKTLAGAFEAVADDFMMKLAEHNRSSRKSSK